MDNRHVLDQAILELRKALHLQMQLCNRADYDIDLDAIEQCGQLISRLLEQVRLVTLPGDIERAMTKRQQFRVAEAELLARRYGLDKLPTQDIAKLLGLEPLPFDDLERVMIYESKLSDAERVLIAHIGEKGVVTPLELDPLMHDMGYWTRLLIEKGYVVRTETGAFTLSERGQKVADSLAEFREKIAKLPGYSKHL